MNRSQSVLTTATVAALAVGLVSLPPQAAAAPVRVEAHAVQLQAIAATEAVAAAVQESGLPDPATTGVAVSKSAAANAVGDSGNPIVDLASSAALVASVLLAPLWYLAAPVTLPLSIMVAVAGNILLSFGWAHAGGYKLGTGLLGWLLAPLALPVKGLTEIASTVGNLFAPEPAPEGVSPAAARVAGPPQRAVPAVGAEAAELPQRARAGRDGQRRPAARVAPAAAVTAPIGTAEADAPGSSAGKATARNSTRGSDEKSAATTAKRGRR